MGIELQTKHKEMGGNARSIELIEDTKSVVVNEMVSQLNASRIPILQERIGGATATTFLVPLLVADVDLWIRKIGIVNRQNNALTNAGTSFALKYALDGDLDFEAPSISAAVTLWSVTGFSLGNFPAKSVRFTNQFSPSALGNTIVGDGEGMIVPKNAVVYLEFVNAEGADRFFDIWAYITPMDYLVLNPATKQGKDRIGLDIHPRMIAQNFQVDVRGNK